jgi:hypothetical protein
MGSSRLLERKPAQEPAQQTISEKPVTYSLNEDREETDWPRVYSKIVGLSQSILKREWQVVKKGK